MLWTREIDRQLGKKPDAELAAVLGISRTAVYHRRLKLGITTSANRPRRAIAWTADMDALLGKHTDAEVAERFDIGEETVRQRRRRLGIAATRGYVYWTSAMVRELRIRVERGETHAEIADYFGVTLFSVRSKCEKLGIVSAYFHRWTPEMDVVLGADSDSVVGAVLGVSAGAAQNRRHRLGVPPGLHAYRNGPYRDPERYLGAEYVRLVDGGKKPREIAAERGVSARSVHKEIRRYRRAVDRERKPT